MTVSKFIEKYGFSALTVPEPEREISGGYAGDLLSWVMGRAKAENVWITIMNNINTIAVASLSDVSLVLLAEGVTLDDDVLEAASDRGVNVASASLSAFDIIKTISSDI